MAPSIEIEIAIGQNIINNREKENWVSTNDERNIDVEISSGMMNIIAKGQSVLNNALNTFRWTESKTLSVTSYETTANQDECRPIITLKQVAEHDTYDDCWIILYDRVYDVTEFLNEHPAGYDVILEYAGRDASTAFRGHSRLAMKSLKLFEIGELPEHERIYRRPGILLCDELPE